MIRAIDIVEYLLRKIPDCEKKWGIKETLIRVATGLEEKRLYYIYDGHKIVAVGLYELDDRDKTIFFTALASDISFRDLIRHGFSKVLEDNPKITDEWLVKGLRRGKHIICLNVKKLKERYGI